MEQIPTFAPEAAEILRLALSGIGALCALSLLLTAAFILVRVR